MRRLLILFLMLAPAAFPYASYSGWCEQGGQRVTVAGQSSTTYLQQSYPNFTQSGTGPSVTVYITGTTSKLPVYSDSQGTVLSNPFPCSVTGQYNFYSTASIADLLFSGTGVNSFTNTTAGSSLIISATDYGAFADGTGSVGTDQTAVINNAMSALHTAGGGFLLFPPAAKCYTINPASGSKGIVAYSNITIIVPSGACLQQGARAIGSGGVAIITNGGVVTPPAITNFHVIGAGTLDGNSANITGSGFGGFYAVALYACSNCSVEGLNITHWLGDGVYIDGTGSGSATSGNNIRILNNNITYSQRDGISLITGTDVDIEGNELAYATSVSSGVGGLGIDVEENGAGQVVTGLIFNNNKVHHNAGQGIVIQPAYDATGTLTVQLHGNNSYLNGCQGLYAVDGTQSQFIDIQGGSYDNNDAGATGPGATCGSIGVYVSGWKGGCSISGVETQGSNTGVNSVNGSNCAVGPESGWSGADNDAAVDSFSAFSFSTDLKFLKDGTCGGCIATSDMAAPTSQPYTHSYSYCASVATGSTNTADCQSFDHGIGAVSSGATYLNLQSTAVRNVSVIQVTFDPGLTPTLMDSCTATPVFPYIKHQGGGSTTGQQTGKVTTVGAAVLFSSGANQFDASWAGDPIVINSVTYTIQSVNSATSITLTGSAGSQSTPVTYTYQPNFTVAFNSTGGDDCFSWAILN